MQEMAALSRGDMPLLLRRCVEAPGHSGFAGRFVLAIHLANRDAAKKSVPALRDLQKSQDAKVRLLAAFGVVFLVPDDQAGMDHIVSLIKDAQSPLRKDALLLARYCPDQPSLREALMPLLKEKDLKVREAALRIILSSKDKKSPAVASAIKECLTEPNLDFRLSVAEKARVAGHSKLVLPTFIELISGPDIERKTSAAMNLRYMDLQEFGDAAKPALMPLIESLKDELQDEFHNLRLNAAYALGKFGSNGKAALPALKMALSEPDLGVRQAVMEAIKEIEGAP